MSKISNLPKKVPNKELPFTFKCTGATTGHSYEGSFVVKVPGVRETSKIGIALARLNDGVPFESLDRSTAFLHNAIAFLSVCLVDGPKWFLNSADDPREEGMSFGMDTDDFNVPIGIFQEAEKLVSTWNAALQNPETPKV